MHIKYTLKEAMCIKNMKKECGLVQIYFFEILMFETISYE